jgi:zinc/manganese transport system substrate-binding protein
MTLNSKSRSLVLAAALALAAPAAAQEPTKVVTTLPYLAEVAREVGGDLVEVEALAPPGQDPHFIVPTPALSVRLGEAEVFIENGITLELWSERVIDGARNQAIRPASPGHVYAAVGIRPLGVPQQQTRQSGDVHAGGNPHVWLDPLNLKHIARNVETCLARVRPGDANTFAENRRAFEARIDQAFYGPDLVRILGARLLDRLHRQGRLMSFLREREFQGRPLAEQAGGWLGRAVALEGLSIISYHQVWVYFEASFGIPVTGTIEERPGIPPTPGHLDRLAATAESRGTRVVVSASYYPFSRAEGVAERIGGEAIVLPTQPGEQDTTDLFSLFDTVFDRLEEAHGRQGGGN